MAFGAPKFVNSCLQALGFWKRVDVMHTMNLVNNKILNSAIGTGKTGDSQQQLEVQSTPIPAGITEQQLKFKNAMSYLAAAVNIISTDGPAGRAGFTASAVCSVSDSPPTLLVCLNRQASVYEAFKKNQVLCVNTLATEHQQLSHIFAGKTPMMERFEHATWYTLSTGSPVLVDAMLAFDCQVKQIISVATHDIFFCEILQIEKKHGARSLIYFDRAYHQLSTRVEANNT